MQQIISKKNKNRKKIQHDKILKKKVNLPVTYDAHLEFAKQYYNLNKIFKDANYHTVTTLPIIINKKVKKKLYLLNLLSKGT